MTEIHKMVAAMLLLSPFFLLELNGPGDTQSAAGGARPSVEARDDSPGSDLGGGWQAFLPAGFEQRVQLVPLGKSQYELRPTNLTFSGVYQRTDDTFQMVESSNGGPAGYRWKVRSPHLMTLVEQTALTGANYENAVLFRSADKNGK